MNIYDGVQKDAVELSSESALQEAAQSSKYDGMAVSDRYFTACLFEISLHGGHDEEVGSTDEGHRDGYAISQRWL